MKKMFVYTLLALFFASNVWAQDEDLIQVVDYKTLEGYFIKPEVKISKGLNYWLITDKEEFDNMFGVAQTMGVKVQSPDFNTQFVFAIAVPETRMQTYLAFKRVEIVNEKDIKILCVNMEDHKQGYLTKPILIGTIAKTPFAKNIIFCDEAGKEQEKISLNKIDKEKQKAAEKQVKAEKEEAEKAEKEAKAEQERAEKEEREAQKAKERAAKEKAEADAEAAKMKAKEEEREAARLEKQRQKEEAAKERRDREEREAAAEQAREEREARLEAERLKKERAELKAREAEDAKERAAIEKEKEEIRKEREERKKERKAKREREEEEDE